MDSNIQIQQENKGEKYIKERLQHVFEKGDDRSGSSRSHGGIVLWM